MPRGQRQSRAERKAAIEAVRTSAEQALGDIDHTLQRFGGARLAARPDALGSIPIETTVAGIQALVGSERVTLCWGLSPAASWATLAYPRTEVRLFATFAPKGTVRPQKGGVVVVNALVCADSHAGPFRRASARPYLEPFTRRRLARRNRQDSVVDVQSAEAEGANTCS